MVCQQQPPAGQESVIVDTGIGGGGLEIHPCGVGFFAIFVVLIVFGRKRTRDWRQERIAKASRKNVQQYTGARRP